MLISVVFGVGGSLSSLFFKYWASLVLSGILITLSLTLIYCKAARGLRPFLLGVASVPAMLQQPVFLACSASVLSEYDLLGDSMIKITSTVATWTGVLGMVCASLWNASVDKKLYKCFGVTTPESTTPEATQ